MNIATRISILFIVAAALLVAVATGSTAQREYQHVLQQLVQNSQATVLRQWELQVAIYNQDLAALAARSVDFFSSPAVVTVVIRDGSGEVLAQRDRAGAAVTNLPLFKSTRGDLSVAEGGLVALDTMMQPVGTGLWDSLVNKDLPMYLSFPVFTSVNPTLRGLDAADFLVAQAAASDIGSARVIGYVELQVARQELLNEIAPVVSRVFYTNVALLLLCALVIVVFSRRITVGLTQLAKLADGVAEGRKTDPLQIKASGEIRDIAQVLNSVLGGFSKAKAESDVGNRLLTRKVDERTVQLSQQEEQLHEAAREINQTRDQLRHLSYYDSLTALPNRRLFTEQLGLLLGLNERSGQTLALLFVNLDNFKRINDSLGHDAGDLTLREVGRRLSRCVRGSDPVSHYSETEESIDVSRLGGDEFTVVLNQLDNVASAELVARRLVEALLEPMVIEGNELVVNPSIGIAIAPGDGGDVETLLRSAGVAMHHAKAATGENVLYFNPDMDSTGVGRLKLESDLRKAVERNELLLHYQPQVNTTSGAVVGAEALLRWNHPEQGLVPPFQFIPLAEEIGVISELGNWVLGEACRQMKELDAAGLQLPQVTINISAFQFNTAFVKVVKDVLDQHGLAAARLELGLTESIMMENSPATTQALQELRELGVRLSVDDFGMGYSPLTYLSRHALDELKIDRTFVADCDSNENSARLVTAIVAMAQCLELGIVAEGVETEEQYRFLVESGAKVIQGYLFSKPVPAAELKRVLAPWHFLEQVQNIQG